ncbi:MAG TPA: hypothetical protein VN026_02200 [Bacteroidia bacterium]|nr:hypothetical protein [Bacteroidia bacterium]
MSKIIILTSKADTVYFTADNSGCFNSYVLEVKMCKQKSGDRKLIMKSKMGTEEKIISSKNYEVFIKKYQASVKHFSKVDKGLCTSITRFELMCKNKNGSINSTEFKNTTCEAEFNPEMFLQGLIRANEPTKK